MLAKTKDTTGSAQGAILEKFAQSAGNESDIADSVEHQLKQKEKKMIKELQDKTMELRRARSPFASTMLFHLSEIKKIGKNDGNRNTTEDEAIQYTKKTVQKLKEHPKPIPQEIALLEELLPKLASEEEVKEFLKTIDTSNKGVTMKALKEHFGPLVDMKMASKLF